MTESVMRRLIAPLGVAAGLAAAAGVASAHHSFAAEFDIDSPVRLEGVITEVEFMNPHSWIHIDVTNEDGTVESWAIEGGTPNTLFRKGINRRTLPVGAEVIVDGYQARDGSNKASGRDIAFTDGRKLFLEGSSPEQ